MALLIDYLEEAAAYLKEKHEKLKALETMYHKVYDSDLVREAKATRQDITKKSSEVIQELLIHLEELRALHRYFPDLLQAFMEDEYIGRIVTKKAWLLDYRPLPAQEAASSLAQLKAWRSELKEAKRSLRGWVGTVDARAFCATYPALRGYLKGEMDKADVLDAIDKADKALRKEGWLVLITDSLIEIPLSKFIVKYNNLSYEETAARLQVTRTKGRGTVAETGAVEMLRQVQKKKDHYYKIITQLFLANPHYLESLKKRKGWLSKGKATPIERFARDVTPHGIKERVWLNDMRKRLGQQ